MISKNSVKDHSQVVDVDGVHVGIIDHYVDDEHLKLSKSDPESGGVHHIIPFSWIKTVEDNKVILSKKKEDVLKEWETV